MSWLPAAVVIVPLLAGLALRAMSSRELARVASVVATSLTLAMTIALLILSKRQPDGLVTDAYAIFGVDMLSALLTPLMALLGWALTLAAPKSWAEPKALSQLLINVALVIASVVSRDAHAVALLWALTLYPTYRQLRRTPGAERAARIFARYAGLSAFLLGLSLLLLGLPILRRADVWNARAWLGETPTVAHFVGLGCLLVAVFIRKAMLPFHSWFAEVFAAAPPGPVLFLVAPMLGAYALVRFAIPVFPPLLGEHAFVLGSLALVTSAYAAGLAFVQTELRKMVAWLLMSQSSLVLVGLEAPEGAGLTGGIVTWLSAGSSMMALGLVAWMLEARFGRLVVDRHSGLFRRGPMLAMVFLLSGLSLVAFPGTIGFASDDLLLRAVIDAFAGSGFLMFFAIALNGFTVLRTYMRLFHGPPAQGPELRLLRRERIALLGPLAVVVWQGLYPAPIVSLGADASRQLLTRAAASP